MGIKIGGRVTWLLLWSKEMCFLRNKHDVRCRSVVRVDENRGKHFAISNKDTGLGFGLKLVGGYGASHGKQRQPKTRNLEYFGGFLK